MEAGSNKDRFKNACWKLLAVVLVVNLGIFIAARQYFGGVAVLNGLSKGVFNLRLRSALVPVTESEWLFMAHYFPVTVICFWLGLSICVWKGIVPKEWSKKVLWWAIGILGVLSTGHAIMGWAQLMVAYANVAA